MAATECIWMTPGQPRFGPLGKTPTGWSTFIPANFFIGILLVWLYARLRPGYPRHKRICKNCQVGPVHEGEDVRTEDGFALSIANEYRSEEHTSELQSLRHLAC